MALITQLLILARYFHIGRLAQNQSAVLVNERALMTSEQAKQSTHLDSLPVKKLLEIHLLLDPGVRLFHYCLIPLGLARIFEAAFKLYYPPTFFWNSL